MRRTLNYDFLECAKKMPSLKHKILSGDFNINDSEVVKWLCEQPDIKQKIFNMAQNRGVIKYDPATQEWRGVDND